MKGYFKVMQNEIKSKKTTSFFNIHQQILTIYFDQQPFVRTVLCQYTEYFVVLYRLINSLFGFIPLLLISHYKIQYFYLFLYQQSYQFFEYKA
ncbi:hypothetical protein FGO68_gene17507 [Halteria grandinella]|uniref:Transmembrane protein n=1 Tax=Halteria grandinella TaxID=5974 RepID=A0A8J8NAN5_HALGN|nr:hypothetical protein FGO68_gene17507 [Halteria grandinella]